MIKFNHTFSALVMCVALTACGGFKVNYNSPMSSPQPGPVPSEGQSLYGHWTTLNQDGKPKHMYVGKTVLLGRNVNGERNERMVLITMDPINPTGWRFLQAFTTSINGQTFLNVSTTLVEKGDGWNFQAIRLTEDHTKLVLHDIGVFKLDELARAGMMKVNKDDEGAAVAEYIRHFGVDGLLQGKEQIYFKTCSVGC